jgi:hypothetical protein
LERVLRRNRLDARKKRGKGSHGWHAHPDDADKHTTVPDYPEISVDLLLQILKQAGKTRDEYLRVLAKVG